MGLISFVVCYLQLCQNKTYIPHSSGKNVFKGNNNTQSRYIDSLEAYYILTSPGLEGSHGEEYQKTVDHTMHSF
jgi:hypothetical protein